jgi:hypothetical protein
VVVHDLDIMSVAVFPSQANPPLIVDPDTVLAPSLARELLQAIRGRFAEIAQSIRSVQDQQLSQRDSLDPPELPGVSPLEDLFRLLTTKPLDHTLIITRCVNIVKGSPNLTIDRTGTDALLNWDLIPDATGSDIVRGDIDCIRSSNGDFSTCTATCLDDNRTTSSMLDSDTSGQGFWYLVRGQNCGGNGTYDNGPSQVGLRDAEIAASGNDCP